MVTLNARSFSTVTILATCGIALTIQCGKLTDTSINAKPNTDKTQVDKFRVDIVAKDTRYGTIVTPTPQNIGYGSNFTIHARAKRGCRFVEWAADPAKTISFAKPGDSVTAATVTGAATITAKFEMIPAMAGVVYVDSAANPAGTKNGRSWFNAYTSLAWACSSSAPGSTFWVTKGTYTPVDEMNTASQDPTAFTFKLENNDNLYGGFMGNETNKSIRDAGMNWKNYETKLSGNIGNKGTNSDNTSFIVTGVGSNVIVDGMIITESRLQVNVGSGIIFKGQNSTLNNSMITKNYGFAITLIANSCKVLNCVIVENSAPAAGSSGLFIDGERSGIIINNCVFALNTSVNGGSAIYSTSSLTHTKYMSCTIVKNICTNSGPAGIYNAYDSEEPGIGDTIVNCIIYGNITPSTSATQVRHGFFLGYSNIQNYNSSGVGIRNSVVNCIDQSLNFRNWDDLSNKNLSWWFTKTTSGLFLQSSSPKDNGMFYSFTAPYHSTDILGASRNSNIDMGAYEFWP